MTPEALGYIRSIENGEAVADMATFAEALNIPIGCIDILGGVNKSKEGQALRRSLQKLVISLLEAQKNESLESKDNN